MVKKEIGGREEKKECGTVRKRIVSTCPGIRMFALYPVGAHRVSAFRTDGVDSDCFKALISSLYFICLNCALHLEPSVDV